MVYYNLLNFTCVMKVNIQTIVILFKYYIKLRHLKLLDIPIYLLSFLYSPIVY